MTSEFEPGEPDIEVLRACWREGRERVDDGRHCPEEAELFDAAGGGLGTARRLEIIAHTGRCGACAESWRVAVDLHRARPDVRSLPKRRSRFAPVWGLAAAAALSLALGLTWLLPAGAPQIGAPFPGDVLRGDNAFGVEAVTPDGSRMSRQAVMLDWTPLENAAEYIVVVRDSDMNEVFADSVEAPPLRVPQERLQALKPGAMLYWYVEAVPVSGKRPRSETRTLILSD